MLGETLEWKEVRSEMQPQEVSRAWELSWERPQLVEVTSELFDKAVGLCFRIRDLLEASTPLAFWQRPFSFCRFGEECQEFEPTLLELADVLVVLFRLSPTTTLHPEYRLGRTWFFAGRTRQDCETP